MFKLLKAKFRLIFMLVSFPSHLWADNTQAISKNFPKTSLTNSLTGLSINNISGEKTSSTSSIPLWLKQELVQKAKQDQRILTIPTSPRKASKDKMSGVNIIKKLNKASTSSSEAIKPDSKTKTEEKAKLNSNASRPKFKNEKSHAK